MIECLAPLIRLSMLCTLSVYYPFWCPTVCRTKIVQGLNWIRQFICKKESWSQFLSRKLRCTFFPESCSPSSNMNNSLNLLHWVAQASEYRFLCWCISKNYICSALFDKVLLMYRELVLQALMSLGTQSTKIGGPWVAQIVPCSMLLKRSPLWLTESTSPGTLL